MSQAASSQARAHDVAAGYQSLPGVPDELVDASGQVRPIWRAFIDHLNARSPEDIGDAFARGDQYLRDAGVFFRQYGETGSAERDWPLSHIPILIAESEWRSIAEGLIQRADLLEAIVADLYGPNTLVENGLLPAALIARSPRWLRPLVGVTPRTGNFLKFIAFDIGRGPDGAWWVLGDRAEAPSGAGFAIENRVATSRVFADFFPKANVHRLAGFFQTFRDHLLSLRTDAASQVAILTPGYFNDTYFEHAYIARYLGFLLLEGEDLTVQHGRLMVRTVGGLSPISVLWRRLDSAFADPLELDAESQLGTPGLVEALRHRSVTMVNALGAGVLDMRGLLAFIPRVCEALRGEPLKMANIATWWCGHEQERAIVRAGAGHMVVGSAFATDLAFERRDAIAQGDRLDELLRDDPTGLVGQEAVTLSTTPAFVEGRLAARPMTLRVFLARSNTGWQVMPGGYARIGRTEDPKAISMQHGGSAADVWVIGEAPVAQVSLLPQATAAYRRADAGVLPARAGDNLYWLGRYVERAEGMIRLLREYNQRLSESHDPETPILAVLRNQLAALGADPATAIPEALRRTLASTTASASRVRDRFSLDGWMALADLSRSAERMASTAVVGADASRALGVLLRKITGFSGLVHDNMHRSQGWIFLSLGRSLERALGTTYMLITLAAPDAPEGALELAVELGDSAMTHRRRYAVATNRNTVVDLLALDSLNPRSILHHVNQIRTLVSDLSGAQGPQSQGAQNMSELSRAVLHAQTELLIRTPETLDEAALAILAKEIAAVSDLITATHFR